MGLWISRLNGVSSPNGSHDRTETSFQQRLPRSILSESIFMVTNPRIFTTMNNPAANMSAASYKHDCSTPANGPLFKFMPFRAVAVLSSCRPTHICTLDFLDHSMHTASLPSSLLVMGFYAPRSLCFSSFSATTRCHCV